MAQSGHGESPPGVGGGDSYFKYKRRTVRPTDSYEHPRMGFKKKKKIGANSPPYGQGRHVFFPSLTTKKCTAT